MFGEYAIQLQCLRDRIIFKYNQYTFSKKATISKELFKRFIPFD